MLTFDRMITDPTRIMESRITLEVQPTTDVVTNVTSQRDDSSLLSSLMSKPAPDPLLVVAVVIFAFGALLILLAIIRLICYFAESKRNKTRKYPYVIRYSENTKGITNKRTMASQNEDNGWI